MLKKLLKFRKKIDRLDDKLIKILTKRAKVVGEVAKLKSLQPTQRDKLFIKPDRESQMLNSLVMRVNFSKNYSHNFYKAVFRLIISASNHLEQSNFEAIYFDDQSPSAICAYYGFFCKATQYSSFALCLQNCGADCVIFCPSTHALTSEELNIMAAKGINFFANTASICPNLPHYNICGIIE